MNKILVIDDDVSSGLLIKDILETTGTTDFSIELAQLFDTPVEKQEQQHFMVDVSISGKDGVAAVENAVIMGDPFSLAFIDLSLGDMNGLEAGYRLKKLDKQMKVVIFSGKDFPDFSTRPEFDPLRKSFFYLQKPFATSEIRQYANVLCEEWESERKNERELSSILTLVKSQRF